MALHFYSTRVSPLLRQQLYRPVMANVFPTSICQRLYGRFSRLNMNPRTLLLAQVSYRSGAPIFHNSHLP